MLLIRVIRTLQIMAISNQDHIISDFLKYWREVFATKPLRVFLRDVMEEFDADSISDEVTTQLHRLTQLDELRKQGVISNADYILQRTEISTAAQNLLKKIEEQYLPILPVNAKAGSDPGFFYSITHANIEEWRYIEKGRIKNKIGIRVNGVSMEPDFYSGDILICSKTTLNKIRPSDPIIVVGKDNSVYLKHVIIEGNLLILKSINPEHDDFSLPLDDVLEVWLVETKIK